MQPVIMDSTSKNTGLISSFGGAITPQLKRILLIPSKGIFLSNFPGSMQSKPSSLMSRCVTWG